MTFFIPAAVVSCHSFPLAPIAEGCPSRLQDKKVKSEQRGRDDPVLTAEELAFNSAKRVAHNDWEDAVRQNRTEARKAELMKSAVVKTQGQKLASGGSHPAVVEHEHTHRAWGHLTDSL